MYRHLMTAACAALLAACGGGSSTGPTGGGGGGGGGPTLEYTGDFHPVAHDGSGSADVYLAGSAVELRLSSTFSTTANPNLEVWLVAADDPMDNQTVEQSAHVSLGALQSATGAQTYQIPSNVDLTQYRSVTIWCVSAMVNFTTAPLMMP